jgi:excisionase family DNA binding protein
MKPLQTPDVLLFDAKTLARLLNISLATLYRMHAAGRLPAPIRPSPGTVRWSRESILKWLAEHEMKAKRR